MNETILKNIEKMKDNREELIEYLTDLKNRGILTKGQVNMKLEELCNEPEEYSEKEVKKANKINTRTPKTMEYAYSNVSAGFSKTGMLVLIAMSVPLLVAMVNLLNK